MSKPDVLEKTSISMAELKGTLQKINKRDEELSFRGERTLEYLKEFSPLSMKAATELKGKLEKQNIARLKEEFIIKIIDTLPRTIDELKVLLQGYTLTLTKDDMEKVMKVVKDYLPKKK